METVKIMKEFAKEFGIAPSEVDKFMEKRFTPKTLDDVMSLPYDLQNHVKYISWLDEPLYSFMKEYYDGQRYETIEVDRVVDRLYDRIYDLIDSDEFDAEDVFEEGFDIDELRLDAKKKAELERYIGIAEHIITTKFGSVTMDW
jgi:hypothetical protein